MKEKSGIPLFIKVAMGTVLVTFMYNVLIWLGLLSPPKTPMAEAEGKHALGIIVGSLRSYHIENQVFPENYEVMRETFPDSANYHSVEISAIDNDTAVFKIIPKVSDLYAFSGMISQDRNMGYQVIICQSEETTKSIDFPDSISQCPSQTRLMVQ